jgi:regulator of nucleoside diphosphate kinase
MPAAAPPHRKALIYVAADQLDQLQNIAQHATAPGSDLLRRELERAIVLTKDDSPSVFVRLNSTVQFEDLLTGRTRRLALVPPQEADIDMDRISVLTPVGAALLGLTPGETFSWTAEDGRPHVLVIRSVADQS